MAHKAASAYRTISEAGEETGLPAHVLRFWESKFSQLRPVKRAGGRRSYRPKDISIILGLKHLLYNEGFTIKGAQKYVKEHGVSELIALVEQGEVLVVGSQSDTPAPQSSPSPHVSDTPLFETPTQPAPRAEQHGILSPARLEHLITQLTQAKAALDAVRKPSTIEHS